MNELWRASAWQCVQWLKSGDVSPVELIDVAAARIEAVDGEVNALPVRCLQRAREQARQVDRHSVLAGLPIAVKDYNDVGGVRTTYGSPLYAQHVAPQSDFTVARLEANGAIPIAKSNVPEWAGGHTVNPVFGATHNPWHTGRSAGGSSGGSAAALASGQVWLATGNDLGGSLRTPASFNAVVGLRPSPGRVPRGERLQPFDTLWVEGPMARSVRDVALMLDAGCGFEPRDPLSFESLGPSFQSQLESGEGATRVAFSRDLGIVPVTQEVADICQRAVGHFTELGVEVTDDVPDFHGAIDGFQTLRSVLLATMMGPLLASHRERIAPDIIGNIERGLNITPAQIFEAERDRWALYQRVMEFFRHHDVLVCPATSVAPFAIEQPYVTAIDGVACDSYIDWFAITFALTMTACPVLSLPCGFTAQGLPVGLQLMGRPRAEGALLRIAHQLESVLGVVGQLPIEPRNEGA